MVKGVNAAQGETYFLSKHRIEALYDGMFAIAMTILVLGIQVPTDIKVTTPIELIGALNSMRPLFFTYILSFFILATIWINTNYRFQYLKHTDPKNLWLNVIMLMLVVLIPFSTSLMNDYNGLKVAEIFFHLNLLSIGLISYIIYIYVMKNHHLVDKENFDLSCVTRGKRVSFTLIAIPLIAIIITFWAPRWSTLSYYFIPLVIYLQKRHSAQCP